MVSYKVTVYTGDLAHFSTFHDFCITLVGTDGESNPTKLTTWIPSFKLNPFTHKVECTTPLGELLAIIVQKEHHLVFPNGSWFVAKVVVESPMGDIYQFPIYRWITDCKDHYFQEGSGWFTLSTLQRKNTLTLWDHPKDGLPYSIKAESYSSLPLDASFSYTKEIEMFFTKEKALVELKLTEWVDHKMKWTNIEDIRRLHCCHRTEISEYVYQNWKEDSFFGYQFLNGVNPMMIQRCVTLPENFQVTDEMVFKDGKQSLTDEMKKGNIFLCDYKMLDGVKANIIDGKQQYLAAPLVLLHKTDDKLMPIAIQLKQIPAEDNPVFFPTDSEWDWLLAKTFVKNADFNMHELSSHLLRTHLLAEVFTVALLRQIPMMHPLYKVLLIISWNVFTQSFSCLTLFASSGGEGMFTILRKALSSMTYRSLCLPDDISDRGLEDVPNFFYRDDGLKLWDVIHSFVKGTLQYYYQSDQMVQEDQALQKWIGDIYSYGFLSEKNTGIPKRFDTVGELVKFVTMVIFTCSAQHSAVNAGQYDFIGWMPNCPATLERPPPSKKGEATEKTLLDTLPSSDITVQSMAAVWLLSKESTDSFLGNYPEQRFIEDVPLKNIKVFKEQLNELSLQIKARNKALELAYTYLDPEVVENSVSV
uniref:Arachidonate epidermal lipoxygenase 3 n=1 Tax=Poecilia latipinna TaxID=48699 RepID=A0A3B3VLV6_9TELE